jgi:hypothetical protein
MSVVPLVLKSNIVLFDEVQFCFQEHFLDSHEINLYSIHGKSNNEVQMYTSIWNTIFSDTKMRPCSLDIMA